MRKVGKAIFFISLILGVIGFVGGIFAIVYSVSSISDATDNAATGSGQMEHHAPAGSEWTIFSSSSGSGNCEVTGPDGSSVPVRSGVSASVDSGSTQLNSVGTFTAATEGTYQVSCDASVGSIVLLPTSEVKSFVGWLGASVFLFVMGSLMIPVVITGLILWLVGRSKEKQATPGPYPPSGGYAPGQYR